MLQMSKLTIPVYQISQRFLVSDTAGRKENQVRAQTRATIYTECVSLTRVLLSDAAHIRKVYLEFSCVLCRCCCVDTHAYTPIASLRRAMRNPWPGRMLWCDSTRPRKQET